MHGRGHYWDLVRRAGAPVHSLSPHKFVPLYLSNLIRLLRRGRFDLVHCHLIAANLIAKPVAATCGMPVLFNHDQCNDVFRYRNKVRLWLDRLHNQYTARIIAVSDSTRDFLLQWEKIPPGKVALIYNAVDPERFFPGPPELRRRCRLEFGLPEHGPVVLGVGRLQSQKNFPGFLEVAAALSRSLPEVRFVIAGDGPDRTSLEHLAHRLGIGELVHFPGFVTKMRELYLAADVLFFPSLFEGTPMTVLEAMASGLPIVASRIDGTAEVLTDGHDAFLVPAGENRAFAERLTTVLQDQPLAQRLARNALTRVRHFTAPAMAQQVESLYLEHLAPR
jgi:glycosyltransferase involved in cell wall biosynthesis